ncbi:cytochrome-c oxidase, cbb3-type subunit III [Sphingosinicella sp. BN140058]|uniref:cytochrome-c oxidase, cbb3-type subunit III n=1 Tax=Sphingosinicella sp. BN140058 TaxID=1892855 RepID=UPI001010C5FC|nr:cytochrome-c oxidase, cbb3-type subunit III [Sphingosinicella sp. BN140058]QAY78727.1 cytochrome-c oxidase, cbb3-type subunit III [Sphingosinicella sp. BN140058]
MADDKKRIDVPTGTETMGHEWDGIEELNTPLPRWWLWSFYATIVWGLAFMVFYPAWPMLSSATKGTLGWTSRGQLEQELAAEQAKKAPVLKALAATPIEQLPNNPALLQAAVEGGRAAFRVNCVACHGSGAAGAKGYPNLNDDDWLWGGDLKAIEYTITHGTRQPDHDATRFSQMPAFGRDGMLKGDEIHDVAAYVRTISHQQKADAAARRGGAVFAQNCASCHGAGGEGNRAVGAPRLTDAIWLYGGDAETIQATVTNSRFGVMPKWGGRLDPATIKMLAAYVHSLGGGEGAAPVETAAK